MEDDLTTRVHELKVAQEALLKQYNEREQMFANQRDDEVDFIIAGSPVQLSSGWCRKGRKKTHYMRMSLLKNEERMHD